MKTCLLLMALASLPAHAASVTNIADADTTIFSLAPDSNHGRTESMIVGGVRTDGLKGRGLVRFAVTNVPPGSVVTNVTLRLRVTRRNSAGSPAVVGLHRLLSSWGEGTKDDQRGGQAATEGEANWGFRFFGGTAWAQPGGAGGSDYAPVPSATNLFNLPASYTFSSPALAADVQTWIDQPSTNHGWILISQREDINRTARRVATRENTGSEPTLIIEFSPPPPVEPPRFSGIRQDGESVELRFTALADNFYDVRAISDLTSTNWSVVTNVTSRFVDAEAIIRQPLAEARRFFQLVLTGQGD
jgi:hypothetical protein